MGLVKTAVSLVFILGLLGNSQTLNHYDPSAMLDALTAQKIALSGESRPEQMVLAWYWAFNQCDQRLMHTIEGRNPDGRDEMGDSHLEVLSIRRMKMMPGQKEYPAVREGKLECVIAVRFHVYSTPLELVLANGWEPEWTFIMRRVMPGAPWRIVSHGFC